MRPEDQASLRAAVTSSSLLNALLRTPPTAQVRANAKLDLAVCRAHGAAYVNHHYRLVQPFLSAPARQSPPTDDLTSSRPPLETVMAGLQRLCDLRTARDRPGVTTAQISLDTLSRIVDAG